MNNNKQLIFVSQDLSLPFSVPDDIETIEIDDGLKDAIRETFLSKNGNNNGQVSGFHSSVTGGNLRKIIINNPKSKFPSIFLKHSPSFNDEQRNLFKVLNTLGYSKLTNILEGYPSNRINQRELMFYKQLGNKIPIRTPHFQFGIFDEQTEELWLFLEDLSGWQKILPGDLKWDERRFELVLEKMAKFHSIFWDKSLKQYNWLGRWWSNRDNDYMSEDVVEYGLRMCNEIFPSVLNNNIYHSLSDINKKRSDLQKKLLQGKQTLIHWDFNPNNILFDQINTKNEDFALLDWQLVSIGVPQYDLAQLIISNIGIDRENTVLDLVKEYTACLSAYTKERVDFEESVRFFDLAVLDHFFRVCGPVMINGRNQGKNNDSVIREWSNCIEWIHNRSLSRL